MVGGGGADETPRLGGVPSSVLLSSVSAASVEPQADKTREAPGLTHQQ
uniref:Uncharacterized protein n=1 Tax=Arundo donax TaxID=35708 RepID=A0A0A8Z8Q4_ARUDO